LWLGALLKSIEAWRLKGGRLDDCRRVLCRNFLFGNCHFPLIVFLGRACLWVSHYVLIAAGLTGVTLGCPGTKSSFADRYLLPSWWVPVLAVARFSSAPNPYTKSGLLFKLAVVTFGGA